MDPGILVRSGAAVAAVAAALLALRFGLAAMDRLPRRLAVAGFGRSLRVLESVALPGACSLHLVVAGGRYLVVGRSASQVSLLLEISGQRVEPRADSDR